SPSGQILAGLTHENSICLWDLAQGRPLRSLVECAGAVSGPTFSPDGESLFWVQATRNAQGRGILKREPWNLAKPPPGNWELPESYSAPLFSVDGRVSMYSTDDGLVFSDVKHKRCLDAFTQQTQGTKGNLTVPFGGTAILGSVQKVQPNSLIQSGPTLF